MPYIVTGQIIFAGVRMRFSPYPWTAKDMIGGNAALDFVNTASAWSSGDPVCRLGGPGAFADWAALAGLADEPEAGRIKAAIVRDPDAAQRLFAKAVKFRSALYRLFNAVAAGGDIDAEDLSALTEWTRRAARYSELGRDGKGFRRFWTEEAPLIEIPLFAIAEAAENLLEHGPLTRLHACGGDNCEWLFVDHSKNGRRRWCSMATCGNDAKVKKYRKRQKKKAA